MKQLTVDFYEQDSLVVAKNLIGKLIIFNHFKAIITETECYAGFNDPASHAYKGLTKRNEVMFGKAGISYVYLIYGMYNCLNIVTEKEGYPSAILIRGAYLISPEKVNLNGPGKLCKYLGIDREHNKISLINNHIFYVVDVDLNPEFITTTRIGITKGMELDWRFVVKNYDFINSVKFK
ncbi:DNA-3-methyladenine glycosylase [Rickettsiales endosymbiont of Stachyamoeba lipophora]|uniref:DNA-3-methyladenine glycosylase n=1 Tax=Rickettsiales endosymbiont of Stachyamoeba lipophora TaxID=2486578 RepID=UPI000F64FD74|nr:DNA-3-methyladenine glycosylase [Rickettsiales endosymbiont of Stachyamoeba lipophora]AZL15636.1 DNA-3-methyladenine glycosylase [Rickettsiales endosymbiont of Stachyamoeba lipophora]